jgi:hypothetical protein
VLAVLPLQNGPTYVDELVQKIASIDRIAAAHILITDAAQTSIPTREKGMRTGDASFAALLLVEGLDASAVRTALWRLRALAPNMDAVAMDSHPIYRTIFSLQGH